MTADHEPTPVAERLRLLEVTFAKVIGGLEVMSEKFSQALAELLAEKLRLGAERQRLRASIHAGPEPGDRVMATFTTPELAFSATVMEPATICVSAGGSGWERVPLRNVRAIESSVATLIFEEREGRPWKSKSRD